jgi:hypothetical protein
MSPNNTPVNNLRNAAIDAENRRGISPAESAAFSAWGAVQRAADPLGRSFAATADALAPARGSAIRTALTMGNPITPYVNLLDMTSGGRVDEAGRTRGLMGQGQQILREAGYRAKQLGLKVGEVGGDMLFGPGAGSRLGAAFDELEPPNPGDIAPFNAAQAEAEFGGPSREAAGFPTGGATPAAADTTPAEGAATPSAEPQTLEDVAMKGPTVPDAYLKQYTENPDARAQALAYADTHGLSGENEEASIRSAINHRLTKRRAHQEWARNGGASAAYAEARDALVSSVFAAAKEGGAAGTAASNRMNSALRQLPDLLRKHGPDVATALRNPSQLRESDPNAYNEIAGVLGTAIPGGGASAPTSALGRFRESASRDPEKLNRGGRYVRGLHATLGNAVEVATAYGGLPKDLEREAQRVFTQSRKFEKSNSGGRKRFEEQQVKPFMERLQTHLQTSQTGKEEARKDTAVELSIENFKSNDAYRRARTAAAAVAAAGRGKGLTKSQMATQMNTLYDELDDPDALIGKFREWMTGGMSQSAIQAELKKLPVQERDFLTYRAGIFGAGNI